ncbi:hypothetical protein LCGC14_1719020 [marine sediment metagenome]|uniref:Uncharacterized protein n=1 Tax=marine sediment metagenome TaxID=412755 RepID=A0A0F9HCS6_9ZZZZ
MGDQVMYVCVICLTDSEYFEDGECEGAGFYEIPGDDITCPCCGHIVGDSV